MGHFSGWAGTCALATILIPLVVSNTENMLLLVPNNLREAAAALGAPQWKITVSVTYRAARNGIFTGILLGIARISGESAPLLFTALNNQFWNTNLNKPMANLPVVIFQFANEPLRRLAASRLGRGPANHAYCFCFLNIIARFALRAPRG